MNKELPLPTLEEYEISAVNGFLPKEMPIAKLSDSYYKKWEAVVAQLPSLLLTKKIREVVDRLPILEVKQSLLQNVGELRRAYSVLCFITNAYVWGVDQPCEILPDCIAVPLLRISDELGLPPLATYSSLVLWNYQPIITNPDLIDDVMDLSNLTTLNTFTGGIDESWFYLVSVMTEKVGSKCVMAGMNAMKTARQNDIDSVVKELQLLAEGIDNLGSILMRMEEMCDPHIFYYRMRPYLAGWKNMAEVGLPRGVKYGSKGEYKYFAGGSNAQSSLIQTLDIILGIEHFPTGKKNGENQKTISANSNKNSFINEMRNYMPKKHREFLQHLSLVSNIRTFVLDQKVEKLTLAYDACLAMLKSFRDKHIQIVTRYIILQSNKNKSKSRALRSGLSKDQESKQLKGTGGTALIPFLKQCRDETGSIAASDWGKKVLSTAVLDVHRHSVIPTLHKRSAEKEMDESAGKSKKSKLGLAGDWIVDASSDEESGIGRSAGHW
ncbi:hypothetical protein HG535_0B05340 [Zygotorulaspora mrakii]|uniref:Indoleamine 2,3-dioxygenase n=1 Tax=Zygotorulaspora mrakii TaxID=42260 RepID=A0A7H9B133_ZYGMR|nr:uncharacterized protein HG535_0B05340 [Zygotorulaspora mrakii]QLG71492.1 hypothetical protein HG535_0B05340 [Zygotorulaspora mrakii]